MGVPNRTVRSSMNLKFLDVKVVLRFGHRAQGLHKSDELHTSRCHTDLAWLAASMPRLPQSPPAEALQTGSERNPLCSEPQGARG